MGKTRIFISSTCYDLSQIRKDLKEGIEAMGHIPILSENKDFPVSPGFTSAENCINAVRNETDVFVLIIGNRYGFKLDSGKSITNTEFLTAFNENIPIYTFTLKEVIHVLPTWRRNPQADFRDVVDDNKVFEFVDEIRSKKGLWNFEFESAQDILEILKSQLSILFQQTLFQHKKLSELDDMLLPRLSPKAIKLLLEKPDSYEMLVFMQMMADEIGKYDHLRKDCKHSIVIKSGLHISEPVPFISWVEDKLAQLDKTMDSVNRLFNAFDQYFGEPGVPSDIGGLYYVARRFGELYASLLNWVIDALSVSVPDTYTEVVHALSELPLMSIHQLENYPKESLSSIQDARARIDAGEIEKGSTITLILNISIDEDAQREYSQALEQWMKDFVK